MDTQKHENIPKVGRNIHHIHKKGNKKIERLAQHIINMMPVALMLLDEQGKVYSVNPALEKITGFSWKEVIGKRFSEQVFMTEESMEVSRRMWEEHVSKGESALGYEMPIINRYGQKRILNISEVAIKNTDESVSWAYIGEDITEPKEARKGLEDILDKIPNAISIGDYEGNLYFVNKAYAELFGKDIREMLSQKQEIKINAETTWACINKIKNGLSEKEFLEKTYEKSDGTKRTTHNTYMPIEYKGEKSILACRSDITELKQAQSKLKEILETQKETIKELSSPTIPIWSQILMTPLLGSFDSMRMKEFQEEVLESVANLKPKVILMDLTGLAHVNTNIISEMVKLVSSIRLLGTRTILVGIKPAMAKKLISIGASLKGISIYATLEQGLRAAIGRSVDA